MAQTRKCVRCGRTPKGNALYPVSPNLDPPRCARCFFQRLAKRHTHKSGNWTALRDLFVAQQGKCAYTGERLVLGSNASIDHRQPKSRGGNGVENLQWVTMRINNFKRNMTHSEFVSLCKKVANVAS